MKNTKSQAGWIIGLILVFLFIIGIVVVLIIVVQRSNLNPPEQENPNTMKLYLKAVDARTGNQVSANYSIFLETDYYKATTPVSSGELNGDSFTEIAVPGKPISVLCWGDNYYLRRFVKIFNYEEIMQNSSKTVCEMMKAGNIEISHTGDLNNIDNIIYLNITADEDWWQKLSVAISWSPGIVNVYQDGGDKVICDKGIWKNYTYYNASSKQYTQTPQNYYVCGICENSECERTEKCAYVDGNKCEPFSTIEPNRFIGKIDKVQYFAKDLNNESFQIKFNVKTLELKNSLDYIEFIFYDKDRRFDPAENLWRYMSEQDGINLGSEDVIYRINYGE